MLVLVGSGREGRFDVPVFSLGARMRPSVSRSLGEVRFVTQVAALTSRAQPSSPAQASIAVWEPRTLYQVHSTK